MARGKKKEENLTLEEKLEQALVPEEEWPYEVPGNWCWVRLLNLCDYIRAGGDKPKNITSIKTYENKVPVVANGILDEGIIGYTDCEKENSNTITISGRGTIGYSIFRNYSYYPVVRVIVISPKEQIVGKYIKYAFDYFKEEGTGTSIPQLTVPMILNKMIPLPSLPEQQRIISHIEHLFTKLDEAKEKVQYVLENSEDRKAAILHKAFSGELTEQWRREHKIQMNSWVHINLKQVCEVNPKKSALQNLEDDLEVSFYPMAAISEITGKVINPQLRRLKEVKTGFTSFKEGDVIFAKITPCMENGKSAVVEKLVNDIGFGSTEFYVLRCNSRLFNCYLHYIIRDRRFRDSAKEVMTGAVGQQRVPKGFLEEYLLYLPTLDEQKEIVKLLDRFIKREQKIEAKWRV